MLLNCRDLALDVLVIVPNAEVKSIGVVGPSIRCFLSLFPVKWIHAINLKNHGQVWIIPGNLNLLYHACTNIAFSS